jgi:hypothetical protein
MLVLTGRIAAAPFTMDRLAIDWDELFGTRQNE